MLDQKLKEGLVQPHQCQQDSRRKHRGPRNGVNDFVALARSCAGGGASRLGEALGVEEVAIARRQLNRPNKDKEDDVCRVLPLEELAHSWPYTRSVEASETEDHRVQGHDDVGREAHCKDKVAGL